MSMNAKPFRSRRLTIYKAVFGITSAIIADKSLIPIPVETGVIFDREAPSPFIYPKFFRIIVRAKTAYLPDSRFAAQSTGGFLNVFLKPMIGENRIAVTHSHSRNLSTPTIMLDIE